jgi:hypothetical protein
MVTILALRWINLKEENFALDFPLNSKLVVESYFAIYLGFSCLNMYFLTHFLYTRLTPEVS